MMRPERSDSRVTGTDESNDPAKMADVTTMKTTVSTTSIRAHHSGRMRRSRGLVSIVQPARSKFPDCPYTASEMNTISTAAMTMEVRTARPTASPTPAGPPLAVNP